MKSSCKNVQFSKNCKFKSETKIHINVKSSFTIFLGMGPSQITFTCSKSTIETLEKGEKYVQNWQYRQQNDAILVSIFLTLNIFHTFF